DPLRLGGYDRAFRLYAFGCAGDEAIAAARQRFNKPRPLRVITEGSTNFANAEVESMLKIDERAGVPNGRSYGLAGYQLPGRAGEEGENTRGLGCESHFATVVPRLPALYIEFERFEMNPRCAGHGTPRGEF